MTTAVEIVEASGPGGAAADPRAITAFEDRYGRGSHAVLLRRLAQPCVSFADIAAEFGVSRERVRQWRQRWAPEAPTGAERRRQCLASRRRRALLEHEPFRAFYQEIRAQLPPHRLRLVPALSGFRRRVVRIDDRVTVLTAARALARGGPSQPASYALPPVPRHAAFVYVQLGAGDFLFVPASALPAKGTTFVDSPGSKYQRFRRTFAAADDEVDVAAGTEGAS